MGHTRRARSFKRDVTCKSCSLNRPALESSHEHSTWLHGREWTQLCSKQKENTCHIPSTKTSQLQQSQDRTAHVVPDQGQHDTCRDREPPLQQQPWEGLGAAPGASVSASCLPGEIEKQTSSSPQKPWPASAVLLKRKGIGREVSPTPTHLSSCPSKQGTLRTTMVTPPAQDRPWSPTIGYPSAP